MATRFQIALPDIKSIFDENGSKTYSRLDIGKIISKHRAGWRLAQSMSLTKFIDEMLESTKLQLTVIECREKTSTRYTWGDASALSISLSLYKKSYLSHGTAIFLHGLTDQLPKTIYVNREQSPKPSPSGSLSQESIDRAFSNKPRTSNYKCTFNDSVCLLLSGKNTNQLEVINVEDSNGFYLSVTSLERTLIDIAVRPIYSGGIFNVAEAYKSAINQLSLNVLIATLKKLNYKYPYHQAIGFYLSRAGMEESKLERLKELGIKHKFYLDYLLVNPEFDTKWSIFYPKGL